MNTGIPTLQLSGQTITVDDLADRKINLGKFCLENHEAAGHDVMINVAWIEFGGGRQVLLSDLTVYDLNRDQLLNPARFTIGARTSVPFLIGFTTAAYEPAFNECTAVGLRLEVGGVQLEALSGIEFVRRQPKL